MRLNDIIGIGVGGFMGAICRYFLVHITKIWWPQGSFPLGVFLVNMLGCLLVGAVIGFSETRGIVSESLKGVVVFGFLGGFTTYSSFAYESWDLFKNGFISIALLNIALQVFLGLVLVGIGYSLSKLI